MDTLDPCSDDDINNDVSSLHAEIIDKNRSYTNARFVAEESKTQNPLELCSWQRWEMTQANHNFECDYKSCFTLIFIKEWYHISKYKRYLDDPSVSVSNQQSLTVTSVQYVPTPPSPLLSLSFPLNLKQWCQQSQLRLLKEKHLVKFPHSPILL